MSEFKYNHNKLSVLAYANGFTLWHYKPEGDENFRADGFFNKADSMLRVGDMILVSDQSGDKAAIIVVSKNQNSEVSIACLS